MTFEDDLKSAMREVEQDSPAPSAVAATVREATTKRERHRRIAAVVGVAAAVAAIAVGTTIQRGGGPSVVPAAAAPASSNESSSLSSASAALSSATVSELPATTASGTALTTVTADPSIIGSSARCYATADVGRMDNYFSITISGGDNADPVAAGPRARDLCSNSWREGTLSTQAPYKIDNPPENATFSVPPLAACVLPADMSDEGVEEVAIIPGDENTCPRLALSTFPG